MEYDIFISYARKDNHPIPDSYAQGWVTAIRDHIAADHQRFSTEPLRIFLDTEEIHDGDDWRHRILGALRQSKILLVCLSPNYFASQYCRWEWEEYIRRQVHQLMGSDSVATVYFVEVPGSDEQASALWLEEVQRGNFTDVRPWYPEGPLALQREEVRKRMEALGSSLWERIQRARRAEAAPGNLRRQNPHFLGRREELRRLHEDLTKGAVGVVTALHGVGGQGKTELAVAYAHGFADCYPGGLWSLGAEGKKELLPLIGELAFEPRLGFAPTEEQKNDGVLLGKAVVEHLRQRAEAVKETDPDREAAVLILLDNVSEPELLSLPQLATLPSGPGGGWLRVVATTRLGIAPVRGQLSLLAVDALDEETALELIREHQPPRDASGRIVPDQSQGAPAFASAGDEAAAREIARDLGGFTLAVEQVGVFLGLHPEVSPPACVARRGGRAILPARKGAARSFAPSVANSRATVLFPIRLAARYTSHKSDGTSPGGVPMNRRSRWLCVLWAVASVLALALPLVGVARGQQSEVALAYVWQDTVTLADSAGQPLQQTGPTFTYGQGARLFWTADGRMLYVARDDGLYATGATGGAAVWEPWSETRVAQALGDGRIVFVDFTAAWCISCQANKKLVLERDAVARAFRAQRVVLLRADWTRRDPAITAELARHGRNGVPLYLVHTPGSSAPRTLPELLTMDGVLSAIGAPL